MATHLGVDKGGWARKLPAASVTAGGREVGAVVSFHAKDMKEAWCLATSHAKASTSEIINYYPKRSTIEPGFRDMKDLRFGLGIGVLRISDPTRARGCSSTFAIDLLTLLGAAGESLGRDAISNPTRTAIAAPYGKGSARSSFKIGRWHKLSRSSEE